MTLAEVFMTFRHITFRSLSTLPAKQTSNAQLEYILISPPSLFVFQQELLSQVSCILKTWDYHHQSVHEAIKHGSNVFIIKGANATSKM
jgi:hypothetical protein